MPWFRVDDKLWGHPKWVGCSPRARALWITAGSWSADQLTDGRIPSHVLALLGGTRRDADALVAAGLWKPTEDGWDFHDWSEFQPTALQVRSERAAAKERQRRARETARLRRGSKESSPEVTEVSRRDSQRDKGVSHGPPDPTRPITTVPTERRGDGEGGGVSAGTLVAEWLEHAGERPPSQVVGQVSKSLKQMLDEGINPDRIRAGLATWHRKTLHPSALPSCVHEAQQTGLASVTTLPDGRVKLPPLPKGVFDQ